jgi:hypothetical protein
MIRAGVVADQAELARIGQVTRPRLTQIMNMLNLASAIQEELLLLSGRSAGQRANVTERQLRPITALVNWSRSVNCFGKPRPSSPRDIPSDGKLCLSSSAK